MVGSSSTIRTERRPSLPMRGSAPRSRPRLILGLVLLRGAGVAPGPAPARRLRGPAAARRAWPARGRRGRLLLVVGGLILVLVALFACLVLRLVLALLLLTL